MVLNREKELSRLTKIKSISLHGSRVERMADSSSRIPMELFQKVFSKMMKLLEILQPSSKMEIFTSGIL